MANRPGHVHADAFDEGYLTVSSIHKICYQQYGRKDGKPVLFLHGGPGGQACSKANTTFFDPEIYRVVLFDQRGAGKSLPPACIEENTSQLLVEDIETLRSHLNIPKWHLVFGGSWGSNLALLYAQSHPDKVSTMILRGVSTGRQIEMNFSRGTTGAAMVYPDKYEEFLDHLPEEDRADPIQGYYKLLTSPKHEVQVAAAKVWNMWDVTISQLCPEDAGYRKIEDETWSLTHARLETHFFAHKRWLEDGELFRKENLDKIRHIPSSIVQGRYDIICASRTAWDLHKAWPETKLHWVAGAGHSVWEVGIRDKIIEVCDEHAKL